MGMRIEEQAARSEILPLVPRSSLLAPPAGKFP
jgi:hypothetical protein